MMNKMIVLSMVAVLVGYVREANAFYNPSTGRWLSRDPIEEEGGPNLFGFVNNLPVGEIDAYGTCVSCKCKGVTFTYDPARGKDGKLNFSFYTPKDNKGKPDKAHQRYGLTITITWAVEGDVSLCKYAIFEPAGGVTGTNPKGSVDPSIGTAGFWVGVDQVYRDQIGISVVGKGKYSINVNITQWYRCWDSDRTINDPPNMELGPTSFTGSGTKKKGWF